MTQFDQDLADFEADEAARIAALHATAPAKIYLQIDPEAEQFDGWDAQTWCSDKINSTDLCYVRKSDSDAEIAELREQVKMLRDRFQELADNITWNGDDHSYQHWVIEVAKDTLAATEPRSTK